LRFSTICIHSQAEDLIDKQHHRDKDDHHQGVEPIVEDEALPAVPSDPPATWVMRVAA
jgi:hypothetical protein